ncbi:MAG TPA: hypothetical protein VHN77_01485 [Phycisphaerales bacterium]|nr:hypothetical protein [Phycisphaerales bacterium]
MTMQRAQCGVGVFGRSRSDARPLPGVMNALAGAPAGWQVRPDPRRRGSFLVLVVGTLALLAVITIVYVALGNQDNRTRAATVKRGQLDEVPSKMADYIAGVIAEDALAISNERNPDPTLAGTQDPAELIEYREATDAPGVWYNVFSNPGQSPAAPAPNTILWKRAQFNPAGTVRSDFDPQGGGAALDAAQVPVGGALDLLYNNVPPSDPWLASSEPTFLDFGNNGPTEFERLYLDKRDWFSITNIAPDGSFVNLANLRPEYSGFGATPEEMRGIGLNSTNTVALKTLYDPQTGTPANAAPWAGAPAVDTDAAQNRPFFWTMYQANAFRPAAIGRNEPANQTWEDPAFRLYQWVDADGDGMLDSRIFEMKEAAGVAAGEPVFIDTLSFGGKYRWFFGSRIIDLSGRVNVNTAGDLASQPITPYQPGAAVPPGQPPNQPVQTPVLTYRVGSTPADVDLLRVLRMTDMVSDAAASGANWEWSDLVATYDHAVAFNLGTGAYQSLRAAIDRGILPPATDPADPNLFYAFDGAYDQPGTASIEDFWAWAGGTGNFFETWLSQYPQFTVQPNPLTPEDFTAQRVAFYREQAGKAFGEYSFGVAAGTPQQLATISRANFTIDDLAELLTRDSINDPRVTTSLESVLAARDATDADTIKLSVLRSERSLEEEMGPGRTRYDASLEPDTATPAEGSARDLALLHAAYDVRGKLTTISNARLLRSGARVNAGDPNSAATSVDIEGDQAGEPITGAAKGTGVNSLELSSGDLKADIQALVATTLIPTQRQNSNDPNVVPPVDQPREDNAEANREAAMRRIFRAYADALAPYSDIDEAWPTTPPFVGTANFNQLRTLFYGYNGPESALLSAAHMAVNLRDMVDADTRPTVATVSMTGASVYLGQAGSAPGVATIGRVPTSPVNAALGPAFPSWRDPVDPALPNRDRDKFRLSIESTRLAPSNAQTIAPAVNVYGIEPQPFLTQVITMAAYLDDRDSNPGNEDGSEYSIDGDVPGRDLRSPGTHNDELLFRIAAFQLTNPFNREVTLSPAWLSDAENPIRIANNNLPNDAGQYVPVGYINSLPREQRIDATGDYYYIQWGDRTYYLGELEHVHAKSAAQNARDAADGIPVAPGSPGTFLPGSGDQTDMVIVKPITIKPGQTVVCYAISRPPREIYENLKSRYSGDDGYPLPTPGTGEKGWIDNFIGGQLAKNLGGETVDLKWIGMLSPGDAFDPDGGRLLAAESTPFDPIPEATTPDVTASPGAGRSVNLWRTVRGGPDAGFVTQVDPGAMWNGNEILANPRPRVRPPNIPENDQLVDRLRLPQHETSDAGLLDMDVYLDNGTNLEFTITGSDPIGSPDQDYGLTLWASCSRRNDPKTVDASTALADRMPSDIIPAYCVEAKYRNFDEPWNLPDRAQLAGSSGPTTSLNEADFSTGTSVSAGDGIAKTNAVDWISCMSGGETMYDTDDPRRAPKFRNTPANAIDQASSATTNYLGRDYSLLYPQINTAPGASDDFSEPDIEKVEDNVNQLLVSRMRVADALLPLGIGPQDTPYVSTSTTPLNPAIPAFFDVRYTTLAEALAIAQGYDFSYAVSTTGPNPRPDQSLFWGPQSANTANDANVPERDLMFDRGNLHLDAFVPFVDVLFGAANSTGIFNPGDDRRVGLGIPAAMSVLEQFTVAPDGNSPSLTRGVQGLININTASQAALRSVPFLAPPDLAAAATAAAVPAAITTVENWWAGSITAQPYPQDTASNSPFVLANRPWLQLDLASTLDAYRRKANVLARPTTGVTLNTAPSIGLDPVQDRREFFDDDPTDDATGTPRSAYADINGLSDLVGLRSVGEVLAVRQRHTESTNATVTWNADQSGFWSFPLGFDAMGFDKVTPGTYGSADIESSVASVESYVTTPAAPVTGTLLQPTVANEFDEKLSIAGAALGTTSVRSDVYAAWFVVMGFQPSDIDACIAASDPLVPSVQRRFLMIVDRSNVTKKGEKPKVLLLKEVPM